MGLLLLSADGFFSAFLFFGLSSSNVLKNINVANNFRTNPLSFMLKVNVSLSNNAQIMHGAVSNIVYREQKRSFILHSKIRCWMLVAGFV